MHISVRLRVWIFVCWITIRVAAAAGACVLACKYAVHSRNLPTSAYYWRAGFDFENGDCQHRHRHLRMPALWWPVPAMLSYTLTLVHQFPRALHYASRRL